MEEIELLRAYVSRTLNMDNDQVAELVKTDDKESLKENALDLLLEKDVSRVDKLKGKGDTTEAFNNGHKKGTNEALGKLEKEAKETFEISKEDKGNLRYIGLDLKQSTDKITISQKKYIQGLELIQLENRFGKEEELNKKEKRLLRGVVGQLNWIAFQMWLLMHAIQLCH